MKNKWKKNSWEQLYWKEMFTSVIHEQRSESWTYWILAGFLYIKWPVEWKDSPCTGYHDLDFHEKCLFMLHGTICNLNRDINKIESNRKWKQQNVSLKFDQNPKSMICFDGSTKRKIVNGWVYGKIQIVDIHQYFKQLHLIKRNY